MKALADYLAETGASVEAFARAIALDPEELRRSLAGEALANTPVAQRIVDVTGGAVVFSDLIAGGNVVELRGRAAPEDAEIDAAALTRVLAEILPELIGGAKRKGDDYLPRLAADAVASACAALSTVTTRRNSDRLVQALLPVFAEILAEMSATPSRRASAEPLARQAAARYLQSGPPRR